MEAKSITKMEAKSITKMEAKSITKMEAKSITKMEAKSITKMEAKSITKMEAKSITKMEAKIAQIDKQYAPRSLVTKVEKMMTGIESKGLERKANLEEKVISILNASSVDYNNLLQKSNSTNASIATLVADMHEVSKRVDKLSIELGNDRNLHTINSISMTEEHKLIHSYTSDCDVLLFVNSNGKFIKEDKLHKDYKNYQQ